MRPQKQVTERSIPFHIDSWTDSMLREQLSDATSWDLKRRVTNFLWQRGVSAVRQLDIQAENGTITIRGTVPSYYQRQLCLSCCEHVDGVLRLVDDITVEWSRNPQPA